MLEGEGLIHMASSQFYLKCYTYFLASCLGCSLDTLFGTGPLIWTFKTLMLNQCDYRMINLLLSVKVSGRAAKCTKSSVQRQKISIHFQPYRA